MTNPYGEASAPDYSSQKGMTLEELEKIEDKDGKFTSAGLGSRLKDRSSRRKRPDYSYKRKSATNDANLTSDIPATE